MELRAKGKKEEEPEIETCFEALYGVMLLRLQKKEISEGTNRALEPVTQLISMLAGYYKKEKEGKLDD